MWSMTGGTPQVSMAEVALGRPRNLPRPAPVTTTCRRTDLEVRTYRVLSAVRSLRYGADSNRRPRQWPLADL